MTISRSLILIQARQTSSRCPNKVIAEQASMRSIVSLLHYRISCLVQDNPEIDYCFAIPDTTSNKQLRSYLDNLSAPYFCGSEDNVCHRFQSAYKHVAREYEYVVRLCADNPFVNLSVIPSFLKASSSFGLDYLQPYIRDRPGILTYAGLCFEVLHSRTLFNLPDTPLTREHVTPSLYLPDSQNPNSVFFPESNMDLNLPIPAELRLTVDYPWDLERFFSLQARWPDYCLAPSPRALIEALSSEPDMLESMSIDNNRAAVK
jgi:spore coat polysaccharide biosynthesis protein SpsF (cytidylyltransferase family)